MVKSEYILGAESLPDWEKNNPDCQWIVLTGGASFDEFLQLCQDFDYSKYQRITINGVEIQNKVYENGYQATIEEYTSIRMNFNDEKTPVLNKLVIGDGKEFVVSGDAIYSLDGNTLYHMEEEKELSIGKNVKRIADYAFSNYEILETVCLNEGLLSIGNFGFRGTGIEKINFPSTLTTLGTGAFAISDLERIEFSECLEAIPDECFDCCWIEDIQIPNSVRSIGYKAFTGISQPELTIPEGVETIASNAFANLDKIILPSTLKEIASDFYYDEATDGPERIPQISVHPDNPIFFSKNGRLYFRNSGKEVFNCMM